MSNKKDITCDKALTNFYECVNKYSNLQNYKDIVEILAKKWDVKKAKEQYAKYKSKWWKADEYLESLIK